jgi:hypothetical protein
MVMHSHCSRKRSHRMQWLARPRARFDARAASHAQRPSSPPIFAGNWLRLPLFGLLAALGCGGSAGVPGPTDQADAPADRGGKSAAPGQAPPPSPAGDPLRSRPDLPADRRALLVLGSADQPEERWVDAAAVEAAGYTLVDLSDSWTPNIFQERVGADGQLLPNRYRRIFVGLANDQVDEDGQPLPPGAKNYLELHGIFPSISVLRGRFLNDEQHPCDDPEIAAALEPVDTVTYIPPADLKKAERRLQQVREELEKARRKAGAANAAELASDPEIAAKIAILDKRASDQRALAAVEKRLTCEGLLSADAKHQQGIYDDAMRLAVRDFQQKQMIYEANYLRKKTVDALHRPLLDNDYDALVRALRERVVSAAAILEDGSISQGPNLVDEYTKITLDQLHLNDVASALAFFKRHPAGEFATLRAAVKLPARPAYYADHMELSIVVDRGDIWYDLPLDEKGTFRYPVRKKYPTLTLYVEADGQKRALARWRTTIGGWRAEQAPNGYEYLRYKMSDVGPRVIRQVIAGPVWIAPTSTPIRSLVKPKNVNSKWMHVVNYDELGPGFLSAYGLIAGYFVIPGADGRPDADKGVRAHGSSNYLSIYSQHGYSHGCHRLPNHLAIRLYSFILRHRNLRVAGDQPMNFSRQFLRKDTVYEMRIPSRGYLYELDPPLPVNVLEGNIRGAQKTPILGYVPEPWMEYPPGLPVPSTSESAEDKAGGGGGGEG